MNTKKKSLPSQKFYEIRCESTKITKIRVVNTNLRVLGLDLHSSSPEPVNFFGTQFSLGGAQFSFGGRRQSYRGHGPCMPPRGVGPDTGASVLQKKGFQKKFQTISKKRSSKIFFQAISKRRKQKRFSQTFRKICGVFLHNL